MRIAVAVLSAGVLSICAGAAELRKDESVLYPERVVRQVRENAESIPQVRELRARVVEEASFWRDMPDEELWALMFGPTLKRSWMVWSDGHSPVTGEPVPMYNWEMDARTHPWKTQDPTSGEWFPKNDFKAYFDSGLDERGYFHPDRADRSLLFNTAHPDPDDPLHGFGVDDGDGYVNDKGERWRFINAYLIYGQWKQLVVGGVRACAAAYLITGDRVYAHKAGILLDRIADFYPEFDFAKQGVLYEGPGSAGYVSTWHDTCEETRELVMAYDMVYPALREDAALVRFLAAKAEQTGVANPKTSFAHIQRNIEERILRDALAHPKKIHNNYPRAEILKAIIVAVLEDPKADFDALVNPMLDRSTAVDGVTGEKGLAGYASFTISSLASFLAEFDKADPQFLARALEAHPDLRDTFRFHIDTRCLGRYYPLIGDTGHFAGPMEKYVGARFVRHEVKSGSWPYWTLLPPSTFRLFWKLYAATGDAAYVQTLYKANGSSLEGLPHDVYAGDWEAFQREVAEVMAREGTEPRLGSVNKTEWHLAILRSGQGENRRALWLDYDAGGGHGHMDALNLGLFAHGLDLMPDFGYPPVQFGGWGSPRARWYKMAAAHNTVLVDRKNQAAGAGATTLWLDDEHVRAVRAEAAAAAQCERFERTAVLVDIGAEAFYVVDVFRVCGGSEHTKFQHSHFGDLQTPEFALEPADDFGQNTQMRNFRMDASPPPGGWRADWAVEDRYELLHTDEPAGLRYWEFTRGAEAGVAEAWIVAGLFDSSEETWIPRLVVRRRNGGEAPLESTFVAVAEPWRGAGRIAGVRRLDVGADSEVALEVVLKNGARDLILVRDPERMAGSPAVRFGKPAVEAEAELCVLRTGANGFRVEAAKK